MIFYPIPLFVICFLAKYKSSAYPLLFSVAGLVKSDVAFIKKMAWYHVVCHLFHAQYPNLRTTITSRHNQ
jgi:hypothetical protein